MAGFNGCVQLFPILARCIVRHRRLRLRLDAGGDRPDGDELFKEMNFAQQMQNELDAHMDQLQVELKVHPSGPERPDDVLEAILAMQRANILVTEASVRIALVSHVYAFTC